MPRDLLLSLQQLALGATIGACIGLFVPVSGDGGAQASIFGPIKLSALALSFVAGFGVEAVFSTLERDKSHIQRPAACPAVGDWPEVIGRTWLRGLPRTLRKIGRDVDGCTEVMSTVSPGYAD